MGQPTGFINYERLKNRYRKIETRIHDYREVIVPVPETELTQEGARCMDCGVPFCHALGCPLRNVIPEFNDAVYRGRWREAWERLELTNNFPEVTGRVCPAPCETSCTLAINRAAVSIKQIELAIVERAFAEGWILPEKPPTESGKRVAIVGSGPAGLAAAQQLRRWGHKVSLFERAEKIGGLLRYGIPDFKLDKGILERRLAQIQAEGVEFETNVVVGEDLSARYLRRKYDGILLAMGAAKPRDLHVPGRGYEGIHFALDFLSRSNQVVSGEAEEDGSLSAEGRKVLVIGGGDTGSDCVGTAVRQGAKSVHQVEIMPRPRPWADPANPQWPQWPSILRTSTSHEEGCQRDWSLSVTQFTGGYDANVLQAHFVRVDWRKADAGGRPVMVEMPETEFALDVDLVLLAMGFEHVEHSPLLEDLGVALDERGNIRVDGYRTNVEGVFSAGDAHTGASLVVRAIDHGRLAAEAIDGYLSVS